MKLIRSFHQLKPQELEARSSVVRELQKGLEQFFPGCQLHQFGSSCCFGVKSSDLDLYLDIPEVEVTEVFPLHISSVDISSAEAWFPFMEFPQ